MNAPDIKEQLVTRAFAIQHSAAPETIRLLREAAIQIADLRRQLAEARDKALEEAAAKAEREGVYPELNVWNGGPQWYQHGKRIAAAIRALKGAAK